MIDPADTLTLALPQPARVRMSAAGRVHTATLDQDLFGDWTFTQSWTGNPGLRGGGKITRVTSFEAGMALMHALVRKLDRQGFRHI